MAQRKDDGEMEGPVKILDEFLVELGVHLGRCRRFTGIPPSYELEVTGPHQGVDEAYHVSTDER